MAFRRFFSMWNFGLISHISKSVAVKAFESGPELEAEYLCFNIQYSYWQY